MDESTAVAFGAHHVAESIPQISPHSHALPPYLAPIGYRVSQFLRTTASVGGQFLSKEEAVIWYRLLPETVVPSPSGNICSSRGSGGPVILFPRA
jgi:hypothetical protein